VVSSPQVQGAPGVFIDEIKKKIREINKQSETQISLIQELDEALVKK
jgi:hypothetical protein